MKTQLLFTFIFAFFASIASAATGGPDSYGYVWVDSNEPGGPSYNWIDTNSSWTLVTGLADDNSVGMVNMGMSFHYYWGDFNQLKIGSNGWLSFENTSNIAHCFPTIPTAGGIGDNFIAPFMTDLNFTGTGNNGEVYYFHDAANDRFIVSYLDVPWWSGTAPNGYNGSNSFQVILNNSDSSIVFQYQTMDAAAFNNNAGCLSDIVVGIEGPTGTLGLSVYQDVVPASNYVIRFDYPDPVLLQVPDISAKWNLNEESKGEFHHFGVTTQIPVNIASVGNTDVTTSIGVTLQLKNISGITIATLTDALPAGLAAGTDTTLLFNWDAPYAGQFAATTTISNSSDINANNNIRTAELEIINSTAPTTRLSYVSAGVTNTGTLIWNSGAGEGSGVYIEPPIYPFYIDSIGAYIVESTGDSTITLEMYADDGPNGGPGTLIHSGQFSSTTVTTNTWVRSGLSVPAIINSGGIYIAWKQPDASSLAIGTHTEQPLSRRGYEFLGGWAEYRDNETQELMVEAFGFSVCASFDVVLVNVNHVNCYGDTTGSIDLAVNGGSPGVNGYNFDWTNYSGNDEDRYNLAAGTYEVTVTDSLGCIEVQTITINQPTEVGITLNSLQDVSCNGDADGEINTTAFGGTPGTNGYNYSWTNFVGNTSNATGLSGGTYILTATDSQGCTAIDTFNITEPAAINLSATVTDETAGNDGSIDLTVSGGVAPYTFVWTNGAGNAEDPSGLSGGTYEVTVTDANGCTETLVVNVGYLGIDEMNQVAISVYPNPNNGEFTISFKTEEIVHATVVIRDLSGREVTTVKITEPTQISIPVAGVYFIEIQSENNTLTQEIIVY